MAHSKPVPHSHHSTTGYSRFKEQVTAYQFKEDTMPFSRIIATFDKPDGTVFQGFLNAYIPVSLKLSDGTEVPAGRIQFPIVAGVPSSDSTGANPAKLPVTVDSVPANVAIEFRIQPVNGNEELWAKFVIPAETGGAPVNLNSLTAVS
jgi:hypothetical protein